MSLLSASTENSLAQNALGTLTTCRPDSSPHVTPVRFTWDGKAGLARVMTIASRRKDPKHRAGLNTQAMGWTEGSRDYSTIS